MSEKDPCVGWNAARTVRCKHAALPGMTVCEEHATPPAVRMLAFALKATEWREASLRSLCAQLAEALEKSGAWYHGKPGENAVETFERIAEEFYRRTGFLAPGKDEARPFIDEDKRRAEWRRFVEEERAAVRVTCDAALASARAAGFEVKP